MTTISTGNPQHAESPEPPGASRDRPVNGGAAFDLGLSSGDASAAATPERNTGESTESSGAEAQSVPDLKSETEDHRDTTVDTKAAATITEVIDAALTLDGVLAPESSVADEPIAAAAAAVAVPVRIESPPAPTATEALNETGESDETGATPVAVASRKVDRTPSPPEADPPISLPREPAERSAHEAPDRRSQAAAIGVARRDPAASRRRPESNPGGQSAPTKQPSLSPAGSGPSAVPGSANLPARGDSPAAEASHRAPPAEGKPVGTDGARPAVEMGPPRVARHPWLEGTTNTKNRVGDRPVDTARFVQRIARAIQTSHKTGEPLRLRLSPPELGALRLELQIESGQLSARIETETTAAQKLLLDQLPVLRERLGELSIRIDQFDVDVGRDRGSAGSDQSFFSDDAKQPPRRGPERAGPPPAEDDPPRQSRVAGQSDGELNVMV